MSRGIPQDQWPKRLQAFTNRNAGRTTILNELDPELGAQEEERGYALRGVAYDPRAGRLDIMLGDLEGTDHHLTRGISDVRTVDIWSAADGHDLALRVERAKGETILRFLDG